MTHIQLSCKTAGFSYGEVAEIGKGKGKIALEIATDLIKSGMAKAYEDKIGQTLSAKETKVIAELEAKVAELEKDNEALIANKTALEAKVAELETATKK